MLFVIVSFATAQGQLQVLDRRLQLALSAPPTAFWRDAWRVTGTIGSAWPSLILLIVLLWVIQRRDRGLALALLTVFVAGSLIEVGLKHWLVHGNPVTLKGMPVLVLPGDGLQQTVLSQTGLPRSATQFPNSYPSGHMLRLFLILGALTLALPRTEARVAAVLAGIAVAGVLLLTRAHWPSDVAGGALLGWSMLAFAGLTREFSRRLAAETPRWRQDREIAGAGDRA
jgi:membrane-associated phospholipid phosphatase